MRKVFLEDLPRGGDKISNKHVNWKQSIGYIVKFQYDEILGEFMVTNYDGRHIYVKYLDNKPFKIGTGDFSDGILGGILGIKVHSYKYNVDDIINNKISILEQFRIGEGKQIHKCYKYKCINCGNTDIIRESQLCSGSGCNVCCSNPRKTMEGVNDIPTTAPWMVKYFQGGYDEAKLYSIGSQNKLKFKCSDCGNIKEKRINQLYKNGLMCNKCGDGISIPNKTMFNILEQLNIKFRPEYSPEWIKPKKYDFYFKIHSKQYIIEMDGGFHFKDNNLTGDKIVEIKAIDDYKDIKAKELGIELIRIDCNYKSNNNDFEYIKNNILSSELSNILNLSIIDWDKVFIFSISSRIHEACNLWSNGINSTLELSKKMNLCQATILNYLKKGSKLNLCNYNPKTAKEEGNKKAIQTIKSKLKKIICLNNDKIFLSARDASDYAKTCKENILNCCNDKYLRAGFCKDTNEFYQWQYYNEFLTNPKPLFKNEGIVKQYNKSGYNQSMKKVICLNTKEIFNSINEASTIYNVLNTNIISNCKKQQSFAGKHPITREKLVWMYHNEYLETSEDKIESLIKNPYNKQIRTQNYKKVICLNNNEIYKSLMDASIKTGISNIGKCCQSKSKSAGKHQITGEKLRWMYYEDYIEEQNNQVS